MIVFFCNPTHKSLIFPVKILIIIWVSDDRFLLTKDGTQKTVRKKEALKKAVHKTIPHLLHLSMLIISSVFLFLKNLVPMLSWQIQEIVVKFKLHKKESKLLPIEQMFPKKELFFREERVLKNERATL